MAFSSLHYIKPKFGYLTQCNEKEEEEEEEEEEEKEEEKESLVNQVIC